MSLRACEITTKLAVVIEHAWQPRSIKGLAFRQTTLLLLDPHATLRMTKKPAKPDSLIIWIPTVACNASLGMTQTLWEIRMKILRNDNGAFWEKSKVRSFLYVNPPVRCDPERGTPAPTPNLGGASSLRFFSQKKLRQEVPAGVILFP